MRSPIRKKLVAHFTRELERKIPQFTRFPMPRGNPPIWAWQVAPTLTFFILLQPFDREDRFALEVAWSEDGEFPWDSIGQWDISEQSGRERYPCWETNKEKRWDLAPEATAARDARLEAYSRGEYVPYADHADVSPPIEHVLGRVESTVEDTIEKLIQNGLPFLRRVADHRGIRLPEITRVR